MAMREPEASCRRPRVEGMRAPGTLSAATRDLGDRVLALGRLRTRGRASGAPGDSPWGGVYDLRAGKVSRIRTFLDHDEASRAAGRYE